MGAGPTRWKQCARTNHLSRRATPFSRYRGASESSRHTPCADYSSRPVCSLLSLFVSDDFLGAATVPAAFEIGGQPRADHPFDLILAQKIGRQAHDVRVVVSAAEFRVHHVAAVRRTHTGDLVRRDAHPVTSRANQDAAFGPA